MKRHFESPVVVLGARSDIARAIARRYAEAGCAIVLAARNAERLSADRDDLQTRYRVAVSTIEFDVTSTAADAFFQHMAEMPGTLVMVAGLLGDQARSEEDLREADLVMQTNYVGPARYLLAAAQVMQARRGACIIGVSSVAGDRGRASNFIYGSSKAGFSAFLSGLRNRLTGKGIHVITVKPGFVDTRMTAGMNLPRALTAQPDEVATAVLKAHSNGSDVVYVRPIWRLIMVVIRLIPEFMFKRLSL